MPKRWIAWESLCFNKKISVLVHAAQRLLRTTFAFRGQNISLLYRRKGRKLGKGAPCAPNSSPVGCEVFVAAGAVPAGWLGPAHRCRAGLSLPGVCLQQPGCVSHPGTRGRGRGMGSVASLAVGAAASTVWGG